MNTFYGPNTFTYHLVGETRQIYCTIHLTLEYKLYEGGARVFCSPLFSQHLSLLIDLIFKKGSEKREVAGKDHV